MSPGSTRCSESTIATMSWSAALTWRSSSLPRYSTTSARARNDAVSPLGLADLEVLGPEPGHERAVRGRRSAPRRAGRQRDRPVAGPDEARASPEPSTVDLDEVHRRAADEARRRTG